MNRELIGLLVPEEILADFVYERLEQISGVIRIHLVEKDDRHHYPRKIFGKGEIQQNGFMNPIELQTFPTQGKEVFLVLKRRRWKVKGVSGSFYNQYNYHQEGMKATRDFGAFLKEIGRG